MTLISLAERWGIKPTVVAERERDPAWTAILGECERSFLAFLPYWRFKDRESGEIRSFAEMWEGQREFAELAEREPWIIALKAGKLGFTELECAFDGWRLRFGGRNTRVHLFSRDQRAAKELLRWVRFGLTHLPDWMRLPIADGPGSDTSTSMILRGEDEDDERQIVAYAAGPYVSVDQSAQHTHVDELARMAFPETLWGNVSTTVAPGGTCHIVTRGNGEANHVAVIWRQAETGESPLVPFFAAWDKRPRHPEKAEVAEGEDPKRAWYEEQAATLTPTALNYYAPRTAADALQGEGVSAFLDGAVWDRLHDPSRPLPTLRPGERNGIVLSLDAGVNHDYFAVVAVTRHPGLIDPGTGELVEQPKHDEAAIRQARVWKPPPGGGQIQFDDVERWIRLLCQGGCLAGHPPGPGWEQPDCPACASSERIPRHNVTVIVYDTHQLVDMAQRLTRDGVVWMEPFDQGGARLTADANLRLLAHQGRLTHDGNGELREHIVNADAKISKDDEHKLRIVKRTPEKRIDLAVAASMGVSYCLFLSL